MTGNFRQWKEGTTESEEYGPGEIYHSLKLRNVLLFFSFHFIVFIILLSVPFLLVLSYDDHAQHPPYPP